jgi:hypothetical protein
MGKDSGLPDGQLDIIIFLPAGGGVGVGGGRGWRGWGCCIDDTLCRLKDHAVNLILWLYLGFWSELLTSEGMDSQESC